MAYDYEIQYRQGKTNKATNALSHMNYMEVTLFALSATFEDLYEKIKGS